MTADELAEHIIVTHRQDRAVVLGEATPFLEQWHDWEHRSHFGHASGQTHAHDEFTARRESVPLVEL